MPRGLPSALIWNPANMTLILAVNYGRFWSFSNRYPFSTFYHGYSQPEAFRRHLNMQFDKHITNTGRSDEDFRKAFNQRTRYYPKNTLSRSPSRVSSRSPARVSKSPTRVSSRSPTKVSSKSPARVSKSSSSASKSPTRTSSRVSNKTGSPSPRRKSPVTDEDITPRRRSSTRTPTVVYRVPPRTKKSSSVYYQ